MPITRSFYNKRYFCMLMKNKRNISFGILITLTVLFCFGIHAYSNSSIRGYSIELSLCSHDGETGFSADIDSCDDDQNFHVVESNSLLESISQMPIPCQFFLIKKFILSVWQPPKIS
jgi:hypothetical protein